jgi:hypothetical protein
MENSGFCQTRRSLSNGRSCKSYDFFYGAIARDLAGVLAFFTFFAFLGFLSSSFSLPFWPGPVFPEGEAQCRRWTFYEVIISNK